MSNASQDFAVKMTGIGKAFGPIKVLDDVTLEVRPGEIHALLGGNGAGKSTILKILRGVHRPDAGTLDVLGQRLTEHSPEESKHAGIAMIFQEMSLVPTLTVSQNIFLANELKTTSGLIDDKTAAERATELFKSLDVDVDPHAEAGSLGAGQRQLTEIVKAIAQKARVLILDEPSTALSAHDVEKLFAFLNKLKAEGVAIIYVSHRMDEIMKIADRATILRDGRHVITAPLSELTLQSIIEHIVGKQSRGLSGIVREDTRRDEILLELKNVSGVHKPRDLNLIVHAGEVVGVAGLLGSGRSAIARLLFGIDAKVSGDIVLAGRTVELSSPAAAIARGIALIPEDRLRQGVVLEHSVADNISLSVFDRISKRGWISQQKWSDLAAEKIKSLKVKTASAAAAVRTLSGGNQQKVVLAKWLASDPRIVIFDEPTAGIDIGSKSEIIQLIRELAREGKAIIVISSELNELLAACDRILVMSDGRLLRDMRRDEFEDTTVRDNSAADNMQFAEHKLQTILQEVRNNG